MISAIRYSCTYTPCPPTPLKIRQNHHSASTREAKGTGEQDTLPSGRRESYLRTRKGGQQRGPSQVHTEGACKGLLHLESTGTQSPVFPPDGSGGSWEMGLTIWQCPKTFCGNFTDLLWVSEFSSMGCSIYSVTLGTGFLDQQQQHHLVFFF